MRFCVTSGICDLQSLFYRVLFLEYKQKLKPGSKVWLIYAFRWTIFTFPRWKLRNIKKTTIWLDVILLNEWILLKNWFYFTGFFFWFLFFRIFFFAIRFFLMRKKIISLRYLSSPLCIMLYYSNRLKSVSRWSTGSRMIFSQATSNLVSS